MSAVWSRASSFAGRAHKAKLLCRSALVQAHKLSLCCLDTFLLSASSANYSGMAETCDGGRGLVIVKLVLWPLIRSKKTQDFVTPCLVICRSRVSVQATHQSLFQPEPKHLLLHHHDFNQASIIAISQSVTTILGTNRPSSTLFSTTYYIICIRSTSSKSIQIKNHTSYWEN